jgi:hypothetical protein
MRVHEKGRLDNIADRFALKRFVIRSGRKQA